MNWFLSFFQDRTFGIARSQFWDEVRDEFAREHPNCAVCGSTKINIHHKKPFFLFPEEECNRLNLISLCDWRGNNCHYRIGHLAKSWRAYNERVDEVARIISEERNK